MGRNMAPELSVGESLAIDIREDVRVLRCFFDELDYDPFAITRLVLKVIMGTVRSLLDQDSPSLYEVASSNVSRSRHLGDLLIQLAALEKSFRTYLKEHCPAEAFITDVRIPLGETTLIIDYLRKAEGMDDTFEEFITRQRRDGEPIHPEVERQLRHHASLKDRPKLPVLFLRRSSVRLGGHGRTYWG